MISTDTIRGGVVAAVPPAALLARLPALAQGPLDRLHLPTNPNTARNGDPGGSRTAARSGSALHERNTRCTVDLSASNYKEGETIRSGGEGEVGVKGGIGTAVGAGKGEKATFQGRLTAANGAPEQEPPMAMNPYRRDGGASASSSTGCSTPRSGESSVVLALFEV